MNKYDPVLETTMGYDEICIDFGYTSLFVTAAPFVPTFSLIMAVLQLRHDAWRLIGPSRTASRLSLSFPAPLCLTFRPCSAHLLP